MESLHTCFDLDRGGGLSCDSFSASVAPVPLSNMIPFHPLDRESVRYELNGSTSTPDDPMESSRSFDRNAALRWLDTARTSDKPVEVTARATPAAYLDDDAFVHIAVDINPDWLAWASDRLRADRSFLRGLIDGRSYTPSHAPHATPIYGVQTGLRAAASMDEALKKDLAFMTELATRRETETFAIYFMDHLIFEDPSSLDALLAADGYLLRYAPVEMITRSAVTAALRQSGSALQFAPPELRDDPEAVMTAVESEGWAFEWASPRLRADRAFALRSASVRSAALLYADDALRRDASFVLEVMRGGVDAPGWDLHDACVALVHTGLLDDRTFVEQAVTVDGGILQYARGFRDDRELFDTALTTRARSIDAMSAETLRNVSRRTLRTWVDNRSTNSEALYDQYTKVGWPLLASASTRLRRDAELVGRAVAIDGNEYTFVDPSVRTHELLLQAMASPTGCIRSDDDRTMATQWAWMMERLRAHQTRALVLPKLCLNDDVSRIIDQFAATDADQQALLQGVRDRILSLRMGEPFAHARVSTPPKRRRRV